MKCKDCYFCRPMSEKYGKCDHPAHRKNLEINGPACAQFARKVNQ